MIIAEPGSWLSGYLLGVSTIRIWRKRGWAFGKGEVKKAVSRHIHDNGTIKFDSTMGFIDAILDSVN